MFGCDSGRTTGEQTAASQTTAPQTEETSSVQTEKEILSYDLNDPVYAGLMEGVTIKDLEVAEIRECSDYAVVLLRYKETGDLYLAARYDYAAGSWSELLRIHGMFQYELAENGDLSCLCRTQGEEYSWGFPTRLFMRNSAASYEISPYVTYSDYYAPLSEDGYLTVPEGYPETLPDYIKPYTLSGIYITERGLKLLVSDPDGTGAGGYPSLIFRTEYIPGENAFVLYTPYSKISPDFGRLDAENLCLTGADLSARSEGAALKLYLREGVSTYTFSCGGFDSGGEYYGLYEIAFD
jgi:hypothetical protein